MADGIGIEWTAAESPLDICWCGDFRHQHRSGRGTCNVHHCDCGRFRFSQPESAYAQSHPEHHAFVRQLWESTQDSRHG